MKKIYVKSELRFAIIGIVIYSRGVFDSREQ